MKLPEPGVAKSGRGEVWCEHALHGLPGPVFVVSVCLKASGLQLWATFNVFVDHSPPHALVRLSAGLF